MAATALSISALASAASASTRIDRILGDPSHHRDRQVRVSGSVVDSYSFVNGGACRLGDESGQLRVVSDRGAPRTGARAPMAAVGASGDKQGKGRAKKDKQEDKKHGHADERGGQDHRKIEKTRDIVVIDRDSHVRIVRAFYAGPSLPPGLAKRESLPPGLSKQLRERGRLPPGLQKRLRPVPPELARRLPPVPPYYGRYFADRDLVIVDSRTDRIVSLIRAVVP